MSDLQLTKRCTGPCFRELPATEEFFNKHPSGKYGLQPRCKDCKYEENKTLRLANPKYFYRYTRDWISRHPERNRELGNRYSRSEKGKRQKMSYHLESTYGLTEEQYQELWNKQNGKCAICRQDEKISKRLHVDHDHEKNIIRGLLCGKCNRGIGMFDDKEDLLQKAIDYLKQTQFTQRVRIMDYGI